MPDMICTDVALNLFKVSIIWLVFSMISLILAYALNPHCKPDLRARNFCVAAGSLAGSFIGFAYSIWIMIP